MGLIECPECGKEISDRANFCIGCGFPIKEYLVDEEKKEKEKALYFCPQCRTQNEIGYDYCINCGNRLTPYYKTLKQNEHKFNGVYKFTPYGKQEVYCPRCGSEDCSHHRQQTVLPGKTKTRYTANLNPLRPFTIMNKKEKVVKKDRVVTDNWFVCNKCGYMFM